MARVVVKSTRGEREMDRPIADHGDAVQLCLDQLTDPVIGVLADPGDVAPIGFKAVHARNLTGVHRVDDHVLEAMEASPMRSGPKSSLHQGDADAPRSLSEPAARGRVETGFHRTIPEANQRYAIPEAWTELGIRRWGFHSRAIATSPGECPSCWPRRYQDHLVPPGRQLVAGGHPQRPVRRVQPGHEPSVRPATQQPGRRL